MALAESAMSAHVSALPRSTGRALPLVDAGRHAAGVRSTSIEAAPDPAPPPAARRGSVLPQRYAIREKDGKRFLECEEAPRVRVVIDPEMSVSRAEALSLGERVILLDGAGSFGPLIDNERQLYNLDHHAGCERLFTLSTCEQALLLVQSSLALSEGDWTLYANEPDLDTVLAIWCLLNYRRVRELRPEARDVLLPLIRLEGAIDANGPELARVCGLSAAVLDRTELRIASLLERERSLKQRGSWRTKNFAAFTREMLRAVDALVYTRADFDNYTRIDAIHGHVEIAPRRVAIACSDRSGIYAVEQRLKARWGEQLAIIALENQPGQYTLRRVSSLAGPDLRPVYDLLNKVDPAVDGRPTGKRWGGSKDIGGSPRPTGTRLTTEEVLEVLARAHRPPRWWARAGRTAGAFLLGVSCLLFWPLASLPSWLAMPLPVPPDLSLAARVALASLVALGIGGLAIRGSARRRPWVFGWRAPARGGGGWLALAGLVGAVPVTAWLLASAHAGVAERAAAVAVGCLALAAGEVWFRGLVHGLLVLDFPVQRPGGPWLLSRAGLVSAAAYATAVVLAALALAGPQLASFAMDPIETRAGIGALALATGLALAALRERSASVIPGIAVQVGAACVAAVAIFALA